MTTAILVAISAMWTPVGIFLLGKGEARSTGAICAFVGATTVVGAFVQGAVFGDAWIAGLLFVHGLFYSTLAYCLLNGIEDLRSVGNISLNTAIVSVIYMILFLTGGPVLEGGKQLVVQSYYLAFASAIYAYLTFIVFLNAYGKFPSYILAVSLWFGVVLSLWVPAFYLMTGGALPF
jgi:predicted neutral ceramidase superfamily lipid hydrolase